jgi:hypothetical protein
MAAILVSSNRHSLIFNEGTLSFGKLNLSLWLRLSFRRRLAAMAGQARRGRIIRRPTAKARDWICRTLIRNTRAVRHLFLLPGGEG